MSIPNNYVISNTNDIYVYFQIINQTEPESVIDFGMFLKRIGAISRNVRGECICDNISMYGIDFAKDLDLPVFSTIYDKIYDIYDFSQNFHENAELGVLLRTENLISKEILGQIIKYSKAHIKRLFVDANTYNLIKTDFSSCNKKTISSENETYYLIFLK